MWNAGAVALTALLTIVALHQATRWALLHSLDELLLEDAEEVRLALRAQRYDEADFRDDLNRKAIGHRRHEWFVKLLDKNGDVIWGSVNAPEQPSAPVFSSASPFTVSGTVRDYTSPVQDDGPVKWIRVGASTQPLDMELARIDRIAFVTWLLSLGISPLMGWFLSGRALRPITSMIQTAADLRPDQLSDRLPNRETGDELDQLAVTVNSLLDRIATDVGEKQDFLANAAHELRTPLAAIRTTADVALVTERSGEEYRDLLAQMMEQTDHLSEVVNQLLLLSESSLPTSLSARKSFWLNELIAKAVDILKVVAEANDVQLVLNQNDPVEMVGNRDQWIQVLNNLIGNAIKYTPRGGRVSIKLELVKEEVSVGEPKLHAYLKVQDTGIGIRTEEQQRIFERFYRVTQPRTQPNLVTGTGLGLSICRAVVESHGGTIRCQSELGIGSVFTIDLPL